MNQRFIEPSQILGDLQSRAPVAQARNQTLPAMELAKGRPDHVSALHGFTSGGDGGRASFFSAIACPIM